MFEAVVAALIAGAVSGLISWGGIRIELRWHRRDIDLAHTRITKVEDHLLERNAHA